MLDVVTPTEYPIATFFVDIVGYHKRLRVRGVEARPAGRMTSCAKGHFRSRQCFVRLRS
jgi:hypothetical protein